MERLTERHYKATDGYYMKCSETCHIDCGEKSYCEEVDNVVDRLGAIEDILGDDYDLDHLRELVEADRDGRCLVLPVKEGDKVWHINFYPFEDCPPEIFDAPFHITDYYQIGNSVFLSEEEAEAALKGENNG